MSYVSGSSKRQKVQRWTNPTNEESFSSSQSTIASSQSSSISSSQSSSISSQLSSLHEAIVKEEETAMSEPVRPSQSSSISSSQLSSLHEAIVKEEETADEENPRQCRIKDEPVEILLERLQKVEYAILAERVQHKIGMTFDGAPKEAVGTWHGRYITSAKIDYFFEREKLDQGIVATLVMPSYFNRRFKGKAKRTEAEAENSACRAFFEDADVLDIAARLPPPMLFIKKLTGLSAEQRSELKAKGYDYRDIHQQLQKSVYMGLQPLGCRNDRWDGAA